MTPEAYAASPIDPRRDLRLQILGPLRLWRGSQELEVGPPQQALLLAVLLARADTIVATSDLIDMIWPEPSPRSAANSLHKYIGALRRVLEPDIGSRQEGSHLHRRGAGYLCTIGPESLDLLAFRLRIDDARVALAKQQYELAMDAYVDALSRWVGPAADGLEPRSGPSTIFSAIDAEFLDACTTAAALAAQLDQNERVIPSLRLGVAMDALHEPVLAALVSALGAVGRQAEAVSVFHDARARLADELGIDPAPALIAAHRRVLGRAQPTSNTRAPGADLEDLQDPRAGMVGRGDEFGVLEDALSAAIAGDSGLVLVEGEPGIGKTLLLEEAALLASRHDMAVAWGRCRDRDGTPTLWPWVEIIRSLLGELRPETRDRWLTGELAHLIDPADRVLVSPVLPDTGARFRLFEQVASLVARIGRHRPLIVILDDLQWADVATLSLFEFVASRLPERTVLVGALRDRAPAPAAGLVHTLAAVSREPRHRRVRLRALAPDDVVELVRRKDGIRLQPGDARRIHTRTAGNPFFIRELARELATGADVARDDSDRAGIPRSVLDVVRDRVRSLDDEAVRLLEVAAVVGTRVEHGVLARVLGVTHATLLDRLVSVEESGFVVTDHEAPNVLAFAHDIVREAIVASTPRTSLAAVHLDIANALEHSKATDDVAAERVAHHLWEAGSLAEPTRTADALICAGRAAAAKSAFDASAAHLRSAVSLARRAQLPHIELGALTQLIAVEGMRSGYVGSALDALERAEDLARRLGRDREAADLLFSRWAAYSQGIQLDRAERMARRLQRQGEASEDPLVRAYGLNAWGIHQWDVGNIGEAYLFLNRAEAIMVAGGAEGEDGRLRRDLQLLWPVMRALMTALHGDLPAAHALLERLDLDADDDPYAVTVWAAFSVVIAALAGDTVAAERAARRGIGVDPDWSFAFLGGYQRLALCWTRAVDGDDAATAATAAAEAERIIEAVLVDPPRSGVSTWYGLLAEMLLAAGDATSAMKALDRADVFLEQYGQRYAEPLIMVLRARTMQALGTDVGAVRALVERAEELSVARGSGLFAHRARELLAELNARR